MGFFLWDFGAYPMWAPRDARASGALQTAEQKFCSSLQIGDPKLREKKNRDYFLEPWDLFGNFCFFVKFFRL